MCAAWRPFDDPAGTWRSQGAAVSPNCNFFVFGWRMCPLDKKFPESHNVLPQSPSLVTKTLMLKHCVFILSLFALNGFGQSPIIEQARKLYESKKYPDVVKLLSTIEDEDRDYAAAQYWMGRATFDQKNYNDAQEYFEEAVEADDKEADYYNWLGNTYGTIAQDANPIKQGFLAPKMKSAWEKAITLDPKNIEARTSLIQYYTQAPGFMGGSYEKAREVAAQITKLNPAQGHRSMGNILFSEKKFAEAENEYLAMVKADPAFTPGLANFYVGQKQYDKAFALFEESVKKDPNDYVSIYQIGRAAAITGQRLDRGEECLKKYLLYSPKPNEPSHAGAHMRLAQIQEKRGNKGEAKKLYQTAVTMDASLKEAQEGLKRTSQ
jgi:tetratricopeptide (TPR) repeat protein